MFNMMSSTSHIRFIVFKLLVLLKVTQLPWRELIICLKISQGGRSTCGGAFIHGKAIRGEGGYL